MTNPGFIDFLSLMESKQGYYSINFGSTESDYREKINALFIQSINEVIGDNIYPFLYEITGDPSSQVRITISPNQSDAILGLMKDEPIEITMDRPLRKITSMSFWGGFSGLRRFNIQEVKNVISFIEEKKGDHLQVLLFTAEPENLDKVFYEVAFQLITVDGNQFTPREKLKIDLLPLIYQYFLSHDEEGKYFDEISNFIRAAATHRAAFLFLKEMVSSETAPQLSGEDLNQVISKISSDSKDDAQKVRSTFKKLITLSEKGRPTEIESSYDLSKLLSALMDVHGTPTKVSNSVKHRF